MRRRLLGSVASGYVLTSLLPAVQGEWRRGRQPIGQSGEGLPTGTTNAASHPNAIVPVITGIAKPLPMAHDRALSTHRTLSREET